MILSDREIIAALERQFARITPEPDLSPEDVQWYAGPSRVDPVDLPDATAMTVEQLRNVYNSQPFRPFVIHLADGRAIPVNHREFIMTVPSGRTVVVAQPDDTVNIIDLLLVTDLELKSAANGPGRRRKA